MDDESPDSCGKMCDDYEKMDTRIKVVHKKMVVCLMPEMQV